MGKLIYIMGKSGTGKSRSMKNIPANTFGLINLEGKDLPFGKNSPAFGVESVATDTADEIIKQIERFAKKYKIIVVDDFQTLMTNEFMRRTKELGYQKWNDIGFHAWSVAEIAKKLPADVCLYVLCHTEENDNGGEKIKTLGKLLDQYVVLESKSTVVLKTAVIDGKYYFLTQNSGNDTVKSPEDMFPSYAINNDLQYVDDKIRNYYGLHGAKSDDELQAADVEHAAPIEKPTAVGKRSRRSKDDTAEKSTEPTRAEVKAANAEKIEEYKEQVQKAVENAVATAEPDKNGAVSFDVVVDAENSVPEPKLDPLPSRTRRTRGGASETPATEAASDESEAASDESEPATPKQRTRRVRAIKPAQLTIGDASDYEDILSSDSVPF